MSRRFRGRSGLWGWVLGIGMMAGGIGAAPTEWAIVPRPDWVEPVSLPDNPISDSPLLPDGVRCLLYDFQIRVDEQGEHRYFHLANELLSRNAVEQFGHLQFDFDPSYETLSLHRIQLRRGTEIRSVLTPDAVRILQREEGLEFRLYDGRKTALVILRDVRPGDVLEYDYTLTGANPVFGGKFSQICYLQWGIPIVHAAYRLVFPRDRPLHFNAENGMPPTGVATTDTHRVYTWRVAPSPAVVIEDDIPAWYDVAPRIETSEFSSWREVAAWAAPLYATRSPPSPEFLRLAADLARSSTNPAQRIGEALRFVQEHIRYLGIEIGIQSHAPSDPSDVLDRRFGDCKDKSLLLVTLLRELGVEAWPALVHTRWREKLWTMSPSPLNFNHVVVWVSSEGREYCLDPTRNHQAGGLDAIYTPDWGAVLVVRPGTEGLIRPPLNDRMRSSCSVLERFDFRGVTPTSPPTLRVSTVSGGIFADTFRGTLASLGQDRFVRNCLDFYSRQYPGIQSDRAVEFWEDEEQNQSGYVETYVITNIWRKNLDSSLPIAEFYPSELGTYCRAPTSAGRTQPMAVPYPVNYRHETLLDCPPGWRFEAEQYAITNAAFEYGKQVTFSNGQLAIRYQLATRTQWISADAVQSYARDMERVRQNLGYSIELKSSEATGIADTQDAVNWELVGLAGGTGVALLILMAGLWLYRPPPVPVSAIDSGLSGIRGWLILPAIHLVLYPIFLATQLWTIRGWFGRLTWDYYTTPGSTGYHPLWEYNLYWQVIGLVAAFIFSFFLLVLFWTRRRSFPPIYIGFLIFLTIFSLGTALLESAIVVEGLDSGAANWKNFTRTVIGLLVWGSYFGVSRRVKSTFIRGVRPPALPPGGPVIPPPPPSAAADS